jgi:VWFA-related protein
MSRIPGERRKTIFSRGTFLQRPRVSLGRSLVGLVLLAALPAVGQSSPASPNVQGLPEVTTTTTAEVPEISSEETTQSFQVKVNLVEVRVVVRDAKGNAVGHLKQDDFVLLDDKKPQTIKRFSVAGNQPAAASGDSSPNAAPPGGVQTHITETRRLACLFDDLNATANELTLARNATEKAIGALAPGEKLAIFTLSGQGTQDFTDDKDRLRAAVRQLKPRPLGGPTTACPYVSYYMADEILNKHDQRATEIVQEQVAVCLFNGKISNASHAMADSIIDHAFSAGQSQNEIALQAFNEIVRRISVLPGSRRLIFLSPGFYSDRDQAALTDSLNRAVHAGVIVNTLDLRGVIAQDPVSVDISQKSYGSAVFGGDMHLFQAAEASSQTDTLMEVANATGGTSFRNRNDLDAGLASLSAEPEVSYLLAFTPQDLKNDGKFHTLKVELKQPSGYTVQARKGYYAPKPGESGGEANREVAEAVFGRDEIHELPLRVQTQFFKTGEQTAQVAVLVRVDVRHMQFRKADGRNLNDLTVVAALFDRNDNFVSGKNNTVRMHIKDETLATKLNSGITLRNNFDISPGSYLVRVVARDAQGKMTTQSEVVDIP